MKSEASVSESVEAFARLCARLDDPFAERADVLGEARLDERGAAQLREAWTRRFLEPQGDELRMRFRKAYRGNAPPDQTADATDDHEENGPIRPDLMAVSPPLSIRAEPAAASAIEVPSFMSKRVVPPTSAPVPSAERASMRDVTLDPMMGPPAAVLPFGDKPSPDFLHPCDKGGAPAAPARSDLTVTAFDPIASPATPALPFAVQRTASPRTPPRTAAAQPGHGGLSLEQYAELCAELSTHPDRRAELFARHGLSDKQGISALADWQSALRADAALARKWQELFMARTAGLRKGPTPVR